MADLRGFLRLGKLSPAAERVALWAAVGLACAGALIVGYFGVEALGKGERPPIPDSRTLAAESTPTPIPLQPGRLVVHATGDVNLDPGQLGALRSSFDAPWTGVRDLFLSDDLTIVNLECAAARGGERQRKEFTFRCDPDALPAMRDAGVEIANLGNNHSGDFGPQALLDSRANLIAARIVPVGAGRDATEANGPVTFSMKGHKVAVLGFGGVVPAPGWIAGANHPGVADGYSTASMVSAVRAAAAQADFVFVTLHWGEELDTQPRADDVARAHALVDAGANAIFGHHAHRLQPLQWYAGRPIFFGLGNFVWPTGGSTAVAEVVVRPDGGMQACLLPARISGGRPALTGAGACT